MEIVLTGDRPTGPLHLGHYAGSLAMRLELQKQYKTYIMIADIQALTDYFEKPEHVRKNIFQLLEDYHAVGLDKSEIFIQSTISAIAELTIFYMNLVSLSRVQRNPTVKKELTQKHFAKNATCGFICYPISQAADITCVNASLVPVGEDQLPMIEQTNEIVRKFNSLYKTNIINEAKAILSLTKRLVGIDGNAKASKSLNNCIFLIDSPQTVKEKVMAMYTDPNHIRVADPGQVKGNVVFEYLTAFLNDKAELEDLKKQYKKGGLGDVTIKQKLIRALEELLEPIRERRAKLNKAELEERLYESCRNVNEVANNFVAKIKDAMKINFQI